MNVSAWTQEPWPSLEEICPSGIAPSRMIEIPAQDYARARACVNALAGVPSGEEEAFCSFARSGYDERKAHDAAQAARIRDLEEIVRLWDEEDRDQSRGHQDAGDFKLHSHVLRKKARAALNPEAAR